MDEIAAVAKEIEREKIACARTAIIEEKLLDGPRLFATASPETIIRVLQV